MKSLLRLMALEEDVVMIGKQYIKLPWNGISNSQNLIRFTQANIILGWMKEVFISRIIFLARISDNTDMM